MRITYIMKSEQTKEELYAIIGELKGKKHQPLNRGHNSYIRRVNVTEDKARGIRSHQVRPFQNIEDLQKPHP